jgi:glycosyltransferase involved in cell wall biosynthesis
LKLSILLPCYNEEQILQHNMLQVKAAADALGKSYEIIVVDDSSKDATPIIAKRLASSHKNIITKRYENGPSRRENLGDAMLTAKGDVIAFMDIDLATDIKHLPALVLPILSGEKDVMIGSRYIRGAKVQRTPVRRIYSFLYNNLIRALFFSRFSDHNCGFKAFKAPLLKELLAQAGYDRSFTRGWFWDPELLIRAQRRHLRIGQIPVVWNRGAQSSFSFGRDAKALLYMFRLRLRLWFGGTR